METDEQYRANGARSRRVKIDKTKQYLGVEAEKLNKSPLGG